LGKVFGLERDCGMLDVKGMPTGITDSQFQNCSSSLLNIDKKRRSSDSVIPAEAGIQSSADSIFTSPDS
jgi:hypothetical protein